MAFPSPLLPPSYSLPSNPSFGNFAPPSSYLPFDDFAPPPPYQSLNGDNFLSVEDYPTLDVADYPTLDIADYPNLDVADYPTLDVADYPTLDVAGVDAGNFLALEHYPSGAASGGGGEDWRLSLPPGMKFRPNDEELILHYLQREFIDASSATKGIIVHADIYDYEPHQLQDLAVDHGDGKMYFYTVIKKIGKSKTDRSIKSKSGHHWKATQAPKDISSSRSGITLGTKTSLAYYEGKRKTQWLMQEYKLASHTSHHSSQELVLAVVYYHHRRGRDEEDD